MHFKTFWERAHRFPMIAKGVYGHVHTHACTHTDWVPDLKDAAHGHELHVHLVPVYNIVSYIFIYLSFPGSLWVLTKQEWYLIFLGSSVPRTGLSICWAIIYRVSILCKAPVPLGGVEEWSDSTESKNSFTCLFEHSFICSFRELSSGTQCQPLG